jgi:hypothetical protein
VEGCKEGAHENLPFEKPFARIRTFRYLDKRAHLTAPPLKQRILNTLIDGPTRAELVHDTLSDMCNSRAWNDIRALECCYMGRGMMGGGFPDQLKAD